ncbi:MAG: (2Fe-2S)-binding protein [Sedimentisphaerales bacterium]|nr:(2Fe-2S)-binding protein [Sedimentisphaerales bacterium]
MITLTIDNQTVQVEPGTTILQAAARLGIHIPAMCYREGCEASTSCMVCVVRVNGSAGLVPSCATLANDGMIVESETEAIRNARRTALELLLSDHVGDCMGPCMLGCPATMDIPRMIRQIVDGDMLGAIRTVKRDIALPAALGRVCPAPCEKICRRNQHDGGVAICLLKRYVADIDLQQAEPYVPDCAPAGGKRVAIIGAGPAGLSAAYYLTQKGHACTVYDDQKRPGGGLRAEELRDKLTDGVLYEEIHTLIKTGFAFINNTRVGTDIAWQSVLDSVDATFLATGGLSADDAALIGVDMNKDMVVIDKRTFATSVAGVFAGGNVAGPKRHLAVRAVADGKEAALAIDQFLTGKEVIGPKQPFNIRMGKLREGEIELFLHGVNEAGRIENVDIKTGFTLGQAVAEAKRCLHCDCRKASACKLRDYSQSHGAEANRYRTERRPFAQQSEHPEIVYESGKCIDCGLCIQIAAQYGEPLGVAFIGRGFDVRVAVPFDQSLTDGLAAAARACAAACPTGALTLK